MDRQVQLASAKVMRLYNHGKTPTAKEAEAPRRELAAARIAARITEILAEAPPLNAAQRDRLAKLLRTGGAKK